MGRTFNSIRNIKVNMIAQLVMNILRFVCRSVFIQVLGKEYLGISEYVDVDDPWGWNYSVYENCAKEIVDCVDKLIAKLASSK